MEPFPRLWQRLYRTMLWPSPNSWLNLRDPRWGALILGEQITFSGLISCAIILVGTSFVLGVHPRFTGIFSAFNREGNFERKKRIASSKAISYDI